MHHTIDHSYKAFQVGNVDQDLFWNFKELMEYREELDEVDSDV